MLYKIEGGVLYFYNEKEWRRSGDGEKQMLEFVENEWAREIPEAEWVLVRDL